jgi:hypothetical protein
VTQSCTSNKAVVNMTKKTVLSVDYFISGFIKAFIRIIWWQAKNFLSPLLVVMDMKLRIAFEIILENFERCWILTLDSFVIILA